MAVDVNPAMARLTSEAVAGLPNVRVLQRDALAGKHVLDAEVLDAVRSGLSAGPTRRFKLVANLPYNIATPLIANLLVHPELCPALMVVTIQRELADRLVARPASAAYGAVSVLVQALAEVSIVRGLPPSVFWPRPKVDSAIVAVRPEAARRDRVGDVAWFHQVVRQVFLHRRKFIRHVLAGLWRDEWTKADVNAWLESQGLSGQLRAERSTSRNSSRSQALRERFPTVPPSGGLGGGLISPSTGRWPDLPTGGPGSGGIRCCFSPS